MAEKSRSSIPRFQQPTGANNAGLVKKGTGNREQGIGKSNPPLTPPRN
ncbi:MAG: hypothetical protein F6K26_20505 [Moorea sp. SIO2I5]|nr:hypothetical protein [Moorena sp. SIO2I5]